MQDSKIPLAALKQAPSDAGLSSKPDPTKGRKFFGGKLSGFTDNRDRHFHQRMLKAYLRGDVQFPFGFEKETDIISGKRMPIMHYVQFTDNTGVLTNEYRDALFANGYNDPGKVFGGIKPGKGALKKMLIRKMIDESKAELKALEKVLIKSKAKKDQIKRLKRWIDSAELNLSDRKTQY